MSVQVKEVLEKQKRLKCELEKKFPPMEGFENLVFTTRTNHPIGNVNIRVSIKNLVGRINRKNPDIAFENFTPHTLRHTFASNCIAKGMNPKTLQKILGHATLQMTMDLYCHVLDETIEREMAAVIEMV